MTSKQTLPDVSVGQRFTVPEIPPLLPLRLLRKTPKYWIVSEIGPDGTLDRFSYRLSKRGQLGKTVRLLLKDFRPEGAPASAVVVASFVDTEKGARKIPVRHINPITKKTMKTKPSSEIRIGAIKAAIWQNETKAGTRYNVTFSRIYEDGDTWKSTESFSRDDLLLLAKVADLAHSWICAQSMEGQGPAQAQPEPERSER
jgi:hypothetical protein